MGTIHRAQTAWYTGAGVAYKPVIAPTFDTYKVFALLAIVNIKGATAFPIRGSIQSHTACQAEADVITIIGVVDVGHHAIGRAIVGAGAGGCEEQHEIEEANQQKYFFH